MISFFTKRLAKQLTKQNYICKELSITCLLASFFSLMKRTKNQGLMNFLTSNSPANSKFHKLAMLKQYEILNEFPEQFD